MTDKKAKAEQCKARGNDYFKASDFKLAVNAYSEAIELDPTNPVLYSNRAMANFKIVRCPSVRVDHPH